MQDTAHYGILEETEGHVVLQDLGPWDEFKTITNAAEQVVRELRPRLHGRRLFYYDSEGEQTELIHDDGRFVGFATV